MQHYLSCECGFRVDSADLDELVDHARCHARRVHRMELSAEQIVELARRASPAEGRDRDVSGRTDDRAPAER